MSSYDSIYDSEKSVKKYLTCPARCNAPKCVSLQFPPENLAASINNMEYEFISIDTIYNRHKMINVKTISYGR